MHFPIRYHADPYTYLLDALAGSQTFPVNADLPVGHWALYLTPHFAWLDNCWAMEVSWPGSGSIGVMWEDALSVAALPCQHSGCL